MNYTSLQVNYDGAIATITLNRPEKKNAISYQLIDELLAAFAEIEKSEAQLMVLTGAGNAFCSGMDLDNLKNITTRSTEENLKDTEMVARLFRKLYDFPKITIAAVNGAAIAGGTGIATLCDFTIASTEAKFGYTEVRIGFTPAIVSSFLIRMVGEKQARDLLLTGRIFGAEEAFRLGMVTEVVAPDQLHSRVQQLCEALLQNSPTSLVATKKLLNSYGAEELDRQIQGSMRANAQIRTTEDFREGITAFLEKRKPKWTGK
ncbi:MAG TPA: enoyl-CoA hydratase-related protein [Candidatus Koribacter sp.]